MQQLANNRWIALAELVFTISLGALIVLQPKWGAWLGVLILLPILLRLLAGRNVLKLPGFVVPVGLVIITAVIGVWAAYDRQAAFEKFWVIVGAVAIFSALANQPRVNLGVVASLVGLMGVLITVIFIFTNDWKTQSSDLDLIRSVGEWVTAIRPAVAQQGLSPNFTGGLLAILAPIPFAFAYHAWKKNHLIQAILSAGMGLIILIGLFLTSSRGAWLAIVAGIGIWLLWRSSEYLAFKAKKSPFLIFGLLLLILILPLTWLVSVLPGGIVGAAERLPGLPTGESRYDLAINTMKLIGDYPFTGGGLRSFAGQYSQYMLVIPFFSYAYSHNFYLDVIFEQGFIGGLSILAIIAAAVWGLMAKSGSIPKSTLAAAMSGAVMISTFTLLIHGFVDDPLYGEIGSPLLFLIPGFAILLSHDILQDGAGETSAEVLPGQQKLIMGIQSRYLIPGILLILVLFGFILFRKPLFSSWYADIGAVQMAKWDLSNWPRDLWNADEDVSELDSTRELFHQAASLNPGQRTAWHRLGLIAMQAREFEIAQVQLENAHQIDPVHRGIRKSLGYVYAWNGEFDQAYRMLEGIGEAMDEMGVYAWWWREHARPDLANQAENLAHLLKP
jgi:O-antigen ligase